MERMITVKDVSEEEEESMKRAGDVEGTPDWQKIEEQSTNESGHVYTDAELKVWSKLYMVLRADMEPALETLGDAIALLEGTPDGDKLVSLHDELTDIKCAIADIADKYENL